MKMLDDEVMERHHSDCQPQAPITTVCKGSPKPSANSTMAQILSHSDNSNEVHYSDTSTSSNIIKQEVEIISAINEEQTVIPHHLGSIDSKSDHYHKLGDWNFEYGHNVDDRSYQTQKVELPKVPIPMTYNFSSHLQGTSMPGLYPCNSKSKAKKEQPSTSYESQIKMELSSSSSFTFNQPVSVIKNVELSEMNSQSGNVQRKGGRFRPGWMENYSWLQYDECLNTMYCKTCRKWSSSIPDIRTSFVEGNGNFRLEIVNHHHKSKAHKLCMAKEEESIPRLDPILSGNNN